MLDLLQEVWERQPQLRLGQLISVLADRADPGGDPFYAEDNVIVDQMNKFLKEAREGPQ